MGVLPVAVPHHLAYAIDTAGEKSDVDFDYLLQTAIRESSLNPKAKAGTSSATGLFQFIDSTWLRVMKQEGPRLGYQAYADAIQIDRDGDYYIADKAIRKKVLTLREDPQAAADLAAAYTRGNGDYLMQKFGRMPSPGELFYDEGGARTIREVYRVLVAKHDSSGAAADPRFAAQQMSGAPEGKWPDAAPLPSRFSSDDMSFTALFSSEGEVQGRALMSPTSEARSGTLFTQLYGQGQAPPPVKDP